MSDGGRCVLKAVSMHSVLRWNSVKLLLQVQATRALLRALQHMPPLRKLWGLHSVQPFQALLESSEPDVRWLAVECLALIAGLVSRPDHEPAALSIAL